MGLNGFSSERSADPVDRMKIVITSFQEARTFMDFMYTLHTAGLLNKHGVESMRVQC